MKVSGLSRYSLCLSIGIAMLARCGRSQPPIAAPGAIPQSSAVVPARTVAHRVRRASSSYQLLYRFAGKRAADGGRPRAGLLKVNGTLYGTTSAGGLRNGGTVYSISTTGNEKPLYSFKGSPDGGVPTAGLIDVKGTLYGTTASGGTHGYGTVYSITTTGTEKVLYRFAGGVDGASPAGLVYVKGMLYGTTAYGGSARRCGSGNCGTVFRITPAGVEKVLYAFKGGSDGKIPRAGLIDVNGTLYGTTASGGTHGYGTVYSITTTGTERVVYSFAGGSDGANPIAGLIDVGSTLYGTTYAGGAGGCGASGACGTVYTLSTSGAEKVLYSFNGADGDGPAAGLIVVSGVLYGTTEFGGSTGECDTGLGCGTVYGLTTTGTETVLHGFAGFADGMFPQAGLTNVNGMLFGTTGGMRMGQCHDVTCGTVFALKP
jgi:uncharacterized repeat protein (TIGR03803 family)